MLFAYFGPETIVPVTSALAAVAGVGMILGRGALKLALMPLRVMREFAGRLARSRPRDGSSVARSGQAPHFRWFGLRRADARFARAGASQHGRERPFARAE
jgi:hypothetical protein